MQEFISFCKLLRLIDQQQQIENSTKFNALFSFVWKKFNEFFEKHIPRCGTDFLKQWDLNLAQNGFVKEDSEIIFSLSLINPQKLCVFERRVNAERNVLLQKKFRREILHQKFDNNEFTIDMDLDLKNEVFFKLSFLNKISFFIN